jgi:hypothetical protein
LSTCTEGQQLKKKELEFVGKENRSLRVGEILQGGFSEYVSTLLVV